VTGLKKVKLFHAKNAEVPFSGEERVRSFAGCPELIHRRHLTNLV